MHNWYSCSEGGPMAISCDQGCGLHLSEDPLIAEPVDARGGTVPPGVRSAKVYLTNLYNPALPLIRYRITDEVNRAVGGTVTLAPNPRDC